MPRSRPIHLYSFVADLIEMSVEVLQRELGTDPERARALGAEIAKGVCFRNAKSTVYIPEALNLANMERDRLIWAGYQVDGPPPARCRKFSPERIVELAAEFDLTPQMVYRIVARSREAELRDVQPDLPGLDPAPAQK